MTERGRSRAWHAAAGLSVGAACSIASAPWATDTGDATRPVLAGLLLGCSALLAMVVTLSASRLDLDARRAMGLTAALAPFGGGLNTSVVYCALGLITEGRVPADLPLLAVVGLVIGALPGLAYAGPLALSTWAARGVTESPAGTIGPAGRLLAVAGGSAVVATAIALTTQSRYSCWPLLTVGLGLCGLACGLVAARDARLARVLGRIVDDRTERFTALPGEGAPGLPGIAPWFGSGRLDTVVALRRAQGMGPYRVSRASRPLFSLAGTPVIARRQLRDGAMVLGALAVVLTGLAASVPVLDRDRRGPYSWFETWPLPAPAPEKAITEPAPLLWNTRLGGTGDDESYGLALGADGTVAVTGALGGPPGNAGTFSADRRDVILASLGPGGETRWTRRFGGPGEDQGKGVAIDGDGNVTVTGSFQGRADVFGLSLTSAGREDVFVASFTPDGALRWVRRLGGPGVDEPFAISVDGRGELTVVGAMNSFGEGQGFVARFMATGERRWLRGVGAGARTVLDEVATNPAGDVVLAGVFQGTLRGFGPRPLRSVGGDWDIVMARLDADGRAVWVRALGGPGFDAPGGVGLDAEGRAWLTGTFDDHVDFGTGELRVAAGREPGHGSGNFVLALDRDGATRWAEPLDDGVFATPEALSVGPDGEITVAGQAFETERRDDGTLGSGGERDVLVVRFDRYGTRRWSRRFGGPGLDVASGVVARPDALVVCGTFAAETDLGLGPLHGSGGLDMVVMSLADP